MSYLEAHTLEEHRQYLHKIVRLQLFFVHLWLEKHPEESFSDVLRNRVDIYRKTDANPECLNPRTLHFDEEPWLSMERSAEAVYQDTIHDRAAFEDRAFEVFLPSIEARCERDYHEMDVYAHAGYQCGSLRHELSLRDDGKTMGFHIANAISPKSIFTDPDYLPGCLRDLMDKVEREYGATRIGTGTWLNMNPKWLVLFPQEWKDNMDAPNKSVHWHYGFWGQFITCRHTFNEKYGKFLRETGELPFYPCASSCSIAALREHLDKLQGKQK